MLDLHNQTLIAHTQDIQAIANHLNTTNASLQDALNKQKDWNEYLQNQIATTKAKADRATTTASIVGVTVIVMLSLSLADFIFSRFAPPPPPAKGQIERSR